MTKYTCYRLESFSPILREGLFLVNYAILIGQ